MANANTPRILNDARARDGAGSRLWIHWHASGVPLHLRPLLARALRRGPALVRGDDSSPLGPPSGGAGGAGDSPIFADRGGSSRAATRLQLPRAAVGFSVV